MSFHALRRLGLRFFHQECPKKFLIFCSYLAGNSKIRGNLSWVNQIYLSVVFFVQIFEFPANYQHKSHIYSSVQKWSFLKHDYDDVLAYCGGCLKATELFFNKILSHITNYYLFIIKILILNT